MGRQKRQVFYTVYDQSEQVIAIGTAGQVAHSLGLTIESFYSAVTRVRTGDNKKYAIYIERFRWDQDPDAEDSAPEEWDVFDPIRGNQHETIKSKKREISADAHDHGNSRNGEGTANDPTQRRRADPEGDMAAALRRLGLLGTAQRGDGIFLFS